MKWVEVGMMGLAPVILRFAQNLSSSVREQMKDGIEMLRYAQHNTVGLRCARRGARVWATTTLLGIALLLGLIALAVLPACQMIASPPTVVVYTSLDQPFSEPVLKDFEKQTGIRVRAVYDVEAAKTTGLASRLIAEANQPRADAFWSSEYAQTLFLKERGVLAAYASPSARDIPEQYRDPEHYWTGFAARARVIIVNSNLVPSGVAPKSIFDLTDPARAQGGVGIANPLFGTTATHAAALFAALGPNDAQKYFQALRERKARVVDGNSVVRDMVVKGELAVGLTDTDDAYIALDKGAPVRVVFPDQESLGAFLIPSTVALVRGAPNPTGAQRLIDYLLSREVEAALARSESKQMPVRDGVPPPPGVPRLGELRWMTVHPNDVAKQLPPSSAWLKEEFLR